jgi:hypothetical protein
MKNGKELILIILLAIAARLPWLVMIPQTEAPDENMHRWVVNYIDSNCRLPDRHAMDTGGLLSAYSSVPPFGYLPHIMLLKLFPAKLPAPLLLDLTRLGSLFMSLMVICTAWWTGRHLFKNSHLAALAVPLMIVFHPQFVFVSSYTNNDMTTAALSSLIIANLILALNNGLGTAQILILSASLSWLILSKYSGLHLLPISGLFLFISAYLHKQQLNKLLRYALTFLFVIVIFTSWWFIRNYLQFDGDFMGVKTMNHLWKLIYHTYTGPPLSMQAVIFSTFFWRTLFFSFWGWFGYMTHSLPRMIYYIYLFFSVFASGLGIKYWRSAKNTNIVSAQTATWLLFALCIVSNLFMCAYCCCSQVSGPQGRYMFPSELAIMSVLVAGLHSVNKKWSIKAILTMLVFNFAAYCYSTYFIYQLYCRT